MFVKYSPSPETAGLEVPKNIFKKQNEISDHLQDFQTRYSRYLRCQNEDTSKDVDPPCDLNGRDEFGQLKNAYKRLYNAMDTLDNDYEKQLKDGKMPEIYGKNEEELDENYDKVLQLRKDLDQKLKTINEYSDSTLNPEKLRSRSIYLINTLLVILIICLIYFYILDL